MAKRIRRPFAENGDRSPVSDDTQSNGEVSYQQGYTPSYSLNPESDSNARRLNRDRYNQIQHDISSNIKEWQEQLVPDFITEAANGGSFFSYPLGMIVYDGSGYRRSTTADNNNDVSDDDNWEDYDFSGISTGTNIGDAVVLEDVDGAAGLPAVNGGLLTGILSLGVGQTWQDVSGSRLTGTLYTNTSGRPIAVTVSYFNAVSTQTIEVDGVMVERVTQGNSNVRGSVSAIVPAGGEYQVTPVGTVVAWAELRT